MSNDVGGSVIAPVLVGMRGSGKSAVAKRLGEILELDVIDVDAEIEKRGGLTIMEIFERHGEPRFRQLEAELLTEILRTHADAVIATGGGAVLHDELRPMLQERFTIWLDGDVDVLASRIASSDRPSLTGRSIVNELAEVFQGRKSLYDKVSKARIDTTKMSIEEVVNRVCEALESNR
jgi:shikimate kinase